MHWLLLNLLENNTPKKISNNYVEIGPKDNIVIEITNLDKGTVAYVACKDVTLMGNIKQKHKFSLNDFKVVWMKFLCMAF